MIQKLELQQSVLINFIKYKIIMDELILNLTQRNQAIQSMKRIGMERHKSEILEQQRKRVQRQNWILKVLKTVKMLNIEQKKTVFQTSVQMMSTFIPLWFDPKNIQYQSSFTEISYQSIKRLQLNQNYNSTQQCIDQLIQSYIIVDLIKSLIDLSRSQFRQVMVETYRELPICRIQNKTISKTKGVLLEKQVVQIQKEPLNKCQLDFRQKIRVALFQKYTKFIDNFQENTILQRLNYVYNQLVDLNQRNSNIIQKYSNLCFGAKRHISYNVSGLYTQQELKKMMKQKNQKSANRLIDLKALRFNPSQEQLKQYFKITLQMHETANQIITKKKINRMIDWFPIVVVPSRQKQNPLMMQLQIRGNTIGFEECQYKMGKKIKYYLRDECCLYHHRELEDKKEFQNECIQFSKKDFLDFNQNKIYQILNKEVPKKQIFLPFLKLDEEQGLKIKIRSESKLPKLIPLISSNIRERVQKQLEKGISYSKFVKSLGNNSNDKINNLIDTILKSRQSIY